MPADWQAVVDLLLELRGCQYEEKPGKSIEIERQLAAFLQTLRNELSNVTMETCSSAVIRYILNLIVSFMGESSIKSQFPQYKRDRWYENLLNKASAILSDGYRVSPEWSQTLDNFVGENTIPIMTIHKSKGLEYDIVVFIGLEDGAFWSFRTQPHEDTCAFFVALSRAKKKVYFTFCDRRQTRRGNTQQEHQSIGSLYDLLTGAGVAVIDHRSDV